MNGVNLVRVLIADDEPIARCGLREMLTTFDDVTVVAEARDGIEAAAEVRRLRPDLIFLDVQMPELDGFAVMATLEAHGLPAVIITTAFEEYALPAFEANAVDYLLKPFNRARLARSLARAALFVRGGAERAMSPADPSARAAQWAWRNHRFVVRDRGSLVFVEPEQIEWIETWGNYVRLFVAGRPLLLRESMTAVETKLDATRFLRISRTVIVNADHVHRLVPKPNGQIEVVLANALVVTGSRRFRERLQAFFRLR